MRSISNQLYKAESLINGIEAFTYNGNEFLVFMTGSHICIYNTTQGIVDKVETQMMGNKLTGCVLIEDKGVLFVATSQNGVKKF